MEKMIHGAVSYSLSSEMVSLFVTREGGHLGPVNFRLGEREVSPYALAPWEPGGVDGSLPVLLKNLRGDFLCLPFGPQVDGEPHGDVANCEWRFVSQGDLSLVMEMEPRDVGGKVRKEISLREGHTAVYVEHVIEGVEGNWSYGTHPILDLSGLDEGEGRLSVSEFRWGSVYPETFSDPADGAQQCLKAGAMFSDLSEVPLEDGETTDLTRYPARSGNDDLVMMIAADATDEQPFAWSACVMDGYVWFALKNPIDFPATLFWLSNGGRSAPPWHSKHVGRVGIEEVCSYFCDSVELSRKDMLRNLSVETTREFRKDEAVSLRVIQGVAAVPEEFGVVASIAPDGDGVVKIVSESGVSVSVLLDWKYLFFTAG